MRSERFLWRRDVDQEVAKPKLRELLEEEASRLDSHLLPSFRRDGTIDIAAYPRKELAGVVHGGLADAILSVLGEGDDDLVALVPTPLHEVPPGRPYLAAWQLRQLAAQLKEIAGGGEPGKVFGPAYAKASRPNSGAVYLRRLKLALPTGHASTVASNYDRGPDEVRDARAFFPENDPDSVIARFRALIEPAVPPKSRQ